MKENRPGSSGLHPVRPWMLALFRRFVVRRRLRKHFSAVRLAFAERLPTDGKLIFYLNHPSWWDPLLCMALAPRFIPGRRFYAPIEAESLKRFAVLRNFGLFPVEIETPRGAVQFLRAAEAVLQQGDVLGLTPQGAFTDIRKSRPSFKAGLGTLMARMHAAGETVCAVPIAIEYTFWNERLPEILVAVGTPLCTRAQQSQSPALPPNTPAQWTDRLEGALTAAQDELASLAMARDPGPFETVLQGRTGTAGLYGAWQRLRHLGIAREPGR